MVDCVLVFLTGWFCIVKSQFLVPTEISLIEEIFEYDGYYEYIFSNQLLEWDVAAAACYYEYDGMLATLETDELRNFAVEAMSESSMLLDGLWLGLQKKDGVFSWVDMNIIVPDEEFKKCGNYHKSEKGNNCGALIRINHSELCLINLNCQADRGFICKRPRGGNSPTTHQGWIRLRHRLYKIFSKRLPYDEANRACARFDNTSRLAVVETYEEAQVLGSYLFKGSPSLGNVWIGARWEENLMQYAFEDESIALANTTDKSGYPPWKYNAISKPFGCLLLDRRLGNKTFFVEAHCDRLHDYMCYKLVEDDQPLDVCDIGDYDWRVYYNKSNWFQATDVCHKSAHSGRLSTLEKKDLKYFIHIMESTRRYLLHVWLGAFFYGNDWIWTYTNSILSKVEENGYPPWVVNRSYEDLAEMHNLCLNIDRENDLTAMFYGTDCRFPQIFICQYDKGTICSNVTTTTPVSTTKHTTKTTRTTTTKTTPITSTKTTTTTSTPRTTTTTTRTTPTTTTRTTPKTTTTTKHTTKTKPTHTTKTTPKTTTKHTTKTKPTHTTRTRPKTTTTTTKHTTKTKPTYTTKTTPKTTTKHTTKTKRTHTTKTTRKTTRTTHKTRTTPKTTKKTTHTRTTKTTKKTKHTKTTKSTTHTTKRTRRTRTKRTTTKTTKKTRTSKPKPTTTSAPRKTPTTTKSKPTTHRTKTTKHTHTTSEGPLQVSTTTEWAERDRRFMEVSPVIIEL